VRWVIALRGKCDGLLHLEESAMYLYGTYNLAASLSRRAFQQRLDGQPVLVTTMEEERATKSVRWELWGKASSFQEAVGEKSLQAAACAQVAGTAMPIEKNVV
jgi:hypothetical protein